jgi:hypothetical protein
MDIQENSDPAITGIRADAPAEKMLIAQCRSWSMAMPVRIWDCSIAPGRARPCSALRVGESGIQRLLHLHAHLAETGMPDDCRSQRFGIFRFRRGLDRGPLKHRSLDYESA